MVHSEFLKATLNQPGRVYRPEQTAVGVNPYGPGSFLRSGESRLKFQKQDPRTTGIKIQPVRSQEIKPSVALTTETERLLKDQVYADGYPKNPMYAEGILRINQKPEPPQSQQPTFTKKEVEDLIAKLGKVESDKQEEPPKTPKKEKTNEKRLDTPTKYEKMSVDEKMSTETYSTDFKSFLDSPPSSFNSLPIDRKKIIEDFITKKVPIYENYLKEKKYIKYKSNSFGDGTYYSSLLQPLTNLILNKEYFDFFKNDLELIAELQRLRTAFEPPLGFTSKDAIRWAQFSYITNLLLSGKEVNLDEIKTIPIKNLIQINQKLVMSMF